MPNEEYVNESLRKIAKGAGIVFIGTGIGMFLAYIGMMIVARFLGPTDFGVITLASAITTIASTIILVGMPEGVSRYVSFYKQDYDQGKIKGVIISSLKVVFPLGIVTTILLFIYSDLISIRVFHDPDLTQILKIFSFSIPFFALFYIFIFSIGGFQEMKYMVYVRDLFQNGTRLFMLVLLLLLGYGVYGAAFAYTFAIIATPFVGFYYLNKVFPLFSKDIKTVSMKKELLSFSWPLMFAGMLGLVMGWIDTLMLGYLLATTDVGIYRASLSTAHLLVVVPSSFAAIFFPVITELYSKGHMEDLKDINAAVTKWILILVLPLVLLLILFSKQVLYILYGEEYVAGALVLCILAFGYLIISLFYLTTQIIKTLGRTRLIMVNTGVGASLDVALNYLLIPIYGIEGAAVATGISLLTVNALAFVEVFSITHIQPIKSNYIKLFFASFASIFAIYVIAKNLFEIPPIFRLILMFTLYMGIYFFLLLVLRTFEKEDVMIMKAIEARTGVKSEWIRNVIGRFL